MRRAPGRQGRPLVLIAVLTVVALACILLQRQPPALARQQRLSAHAPDPRRDQALQTRGASDPEKERLPSADVWAQSGPVAPRSRSTQLALQAQLPVEAVQRLSWMCGKCLYHTLTHYLIVHGQDGTVFVNTGDIYAMWTRDSAVQMGLYLPRIRKRPWMRRLLEGTIHALSFFILQDPWANAYNPAFKPISQTNKQDRILGRGGWVWNRNFELDSSAYFFNLLYNFYATPGIWAPERLLNETLVHDAVVTMLQVLELEQDHAQRSPYRYSELPNEGIGKPTNFTGLLWTGFRPSDDPVDLPFNIPANMYLAGALHRLQLLNNRLWHDPYIGFAAAQLATGIAQGVERYGIAEVLDDAAPGGSGRKVKVYAYEVDGLGHQVLDYDDSNLPSLLSIPLLGYDAYDPQIYAATRARILSSRNPYYFNGTRLSGLGSRHTGGNLIWPLSHMTRALTTEDPSEQAQLLLDLLVMAPGEGGLQHESVDVNDPARFTRPDFGWAQAMLVATVEQLLGVDCDAEAEKVRAKGIEDGIGKAPAYIANNGKDRAYYYNELSAEVHYQTPVEARQR